MKVGFSMVWTTSGFFISIFPFNQMSLLPFLVTTPAAGSDANIFPVFQWGEGQESPPRVIP